MLFNVLTLFIVDEMQTKIHNRWLFSRDDNWHNCEKKMSNKTHMFSGEVCMEFSGNAEQQKLDIQGD